MPAMRLVGLVAALTSVVACGAPFWNSPPPKPWTPPPLSDLPAGSLDASERGVQQWVLNYRRGKSRVLLVQDSTLEFAYQRFRDSVWRDDSSLVASLRTRNSSRVALVAESLSVTVPVILVSDSVVRSRDWRALYRRHRGASSILAVSRVGFNADTTRALVDLQTLCSPDLCGGIQRILLARAPGRAWTLWRADWIVNY